MPISVFNADDHPLLRKGITDLIRERPQLQWAGSAANGREAVEKIREIKPDVAIIDVEMPHLNGIEAAKLLLAEGCPTQFILLTLFKERRLLQQALETGIKGYLLKESNEEEIVSAIESVVQGRAYVNASLTQFLVNADPAEDPLSALTEHERNIVKLIAQEKSTADIADMLFLSPKTIANHRNNISKKLGLKGEQNGLLKWALAHRDLF